MKNSPEYPPPSDSDDLSTVLYDTCTSFETHRHLCPYDVDGAVIKVNCIKEQENMGSNSKYPKWAAAFKFSSVQKVTQLEAIEVQVGRLGRLTPIAILKPVEINGVIIQRATLHNEDIVNNLFGESLIGCDVTNYSDLAIDVVMCRSGDVIPKILGLASPQNMMEISTLVVPISGIGVNEEERIKPMLYQLPRTCPSCGSVTIRAEGEVSVTCSGDMFTCPAQRLEAIR